MEFTNSCLPGCNPLQVLNLNYAFNIEDINNITIYNENNCAYDFKDLQFAYSADAVCWSCDMSYDNLLENAIGLKQDFYVRFIIAGAVSKIIIDGEDFTDYTLNLKTGFNFVSGAEQSTNTNIWNPYANMECAISLQQQLTENISNMLGIPIRYFKLAPNKGSKDITFKEYTLMDVEAVKQIKLIVADGLMPSSRPEFNDWGLEWQTDWECEISKATFATAFGNNAQPMEGDIIWIPMMKRMWMVNEAYEEKKDALMWNATTFKVALVKYQEKDSVNLGDTEAMVNSFVKNKYEDLFGDQESLDSGVETVDTGQATQGTLYPVYESDATRKYVTVETVHNTEVSLYQKGTLISDLRYVLDSNASTITYQRKFCGKNGTISFIVTPFQTAEELEGILCKVGNIEIKYKQNIDTLELYVNCVKKLKLILYSNITYFVFLRWSKVLNNVEFFAAEYSHPDMPIYKIQPQHYYFDIDNAKKSIAKYNLELHQDNKSDISIHNFNGGITNIKIFDTYQNNISEILQMYPTNQHLLVNDTARKLLDLNGISNR